MYKLHTNMPCNVMSINITGKYGICEVQCNQFPFQYKRVDLYVRGGSIKDLTILPTINTFHSKHVSVKYQKNTSSEVNQLNTSKIIVR